MAQASLPAQRTVTFCRRPFSFWGCWVAANALAEAIGLGTSALLWLAFLFTAEARWGVWVSAILVVIGSTLLEGTAVGWFQWSILRRVIPALPLRSWWFATAIGAFVAWTLGMIPSTLMASMEETATAGAPPEPSALLLYTAAAGMGLVLGPILGLPQWWVLRRYVKGAWLWLPANAVAWAWGMILIFAVVGMVAELGFNVLGVVLILGGLLFAGAVVGAIHGYVLVKLLGKQLSSPL